MELLDKFIADGETSVPLEDVGPVTQEEADRADELFKKITKEVK